MNITIFYYILILYNSKKMKYTITKYSFAQAKKLGVSIRQATNKTKKIDVFRNNKKIATIGALGMNDYPTYIKKKGIDYARTRRKLYKQRHEKDRHIKDSNGYWADKILW